MTFWVARGSEGDLHLAESDVHPIPNTFMMVVAAIDCSSCREAEEERKLPWLVNFGFDNVREATEEDIAMFVLAKTVGAEP
jgi:hypothetical protein